jgi:histone chaperone ASF1
MSLVKVSNVRINNNPGKFTDDLEFDVEFDVVEDLADDLEWKLIYVGSGQSKDHDQLLDSVSVGPVKAGINRFVFKCAGPNANKIPTEDLLGSTVILLTCAYKDNEFIRIGYFVNNDYVDEELRNSPPSTPQLDKIERNIAVEQPRITTYAVDWK